MKISRNLLLPAALSMTLPAFAVEYEFAIKYDPDAVDTSGWKCKYCEYDEGYSGELDVGLGWVSEDSFKFGEYNGLNEEGGYFIGNARLLYRNEEDGRYYDLHAHDIGLDTRSLSIEGGLQGHYDVFLHYDELPHYISDSARTPFTGTGPGWVTAPVTAEMDALEASLREVDLETERKRFGIGGRLMQEGKNWGQRWEYKVSLRREDRDGARRTSGAFLFNSAQLVRPVDYETDEVDVSVAYNSRKFQAQLAYYGSFFYNDDKALVWDNPYTPTNGGDSGQLALPPDNEFHQVMASAGYQFSDRTRATADIAVGRMEQDEDFLPATVNAALGPVPLPRASLDGEVDTLTANLRLSSALSDTLRLNASYSYNERDNDTPQADYTRVLTDSFVSATTRTNLPYSYTRDTFKLGADYRLPKGSRLRAGYEYDAYNRDFQEVDKTEENSLWAKLKWRIDYKTHLSFKYTYAERDGDGYEPVPEISGPQNPLLRKYNMADRTRNLIGVNASLSPTERVSLGAGVDYIDDDYENSDLGLTDSRELNLSADASLVLNEKTIMSLYLNRENIESSQKGFSIAEWSADNDDTVNTAGIGIRYQAIEDKLDIGADYMRSRSSGEIKVSGSDSDFPDLETERDTFKLYATYRIKEDISLHAAYWYEHYDSDDWYLDGVEPDTISNVLSLGEDSPSYNVNALGLSVRYNF